MAKLRKMLGSPDSPYIISLMRLIETQSKHTISCWAVFYAQQVMLPIYEKSALKSECVRSALETAQAYLVKEKKLTEVKAAAKEVMAQAKQPGLSPSEQAAVRAISSSLSSISTPTSALGMCFYAAAALAYDRVGTEETDAVYEQIATEECQKMYQRLQEIAVEHEENPAKIDWNC